LTSLDVNLTSVQAQLFLYACNFDVHASHGTSSRKAVQAGFGRESRQRFASNQPWELKPYQCL